MSLKEAYGQLVNMGKMFIDICSQEVQIKTIQYLAPVKMAYTSVGGKISSDSGSTENSGEISKKKVRIEPLHDPGILLLGIYPKHTKTLI